MTSVMSAPPGTGAYSSSFHPVNDPLSYLGPISAAPNGQYINDLRWKCGLIIGTADWFVSSICGFSPLDEWVMKPFAGDWTEFDRATVAWRQSGQAVGAVSENLEHITRQVGDAWLGEARDMWDQANVTLRERMGSLPEACDAMSQFTEALSELAKAIADMVAELLSLIADTVTRILLEQCIPIVGQIFGAGEVVVLTVRVTWGSKKTYDAICRFKKFVSTMDRIKTIIERVLPLILAAARALQAGSTAGRAVSGAGTTTGPPGRSSRPTTGQPISSGGGSW